MPDQPTTEPRPTGRLFTLQRDEDVTGVSGTGPVAHGIQFPDGTVALRWSTSTASTVLWNSIEDAIRVHGHDGRTRVVWDGDQLRELIDELRDPDPCRHDHHGYCQAHFWFYTEATCPHARAAELFPEEPQP
jgi:hypothetical protein